MAIVLILAGAVLIARAGIWAITRVQLAQFRKAGYPVSLAELDRWYSAVPDNENAAVIYGQAFSVLKVDAEASALLNNELTNSFARTVALLPERKGEITTVLASNPEAPELLEQDPRRAKCRYPINLNKGFAEPLPHLHGVRKGVRLLLLKAVLEADEDSPEEACRTLTGALGLSRSLAGEPDLLSEFVRLAAVDQALRALELVLGQRQLSAEQLTVLAANMHPEEFPGALGRAFAGERCFGIYAFGLSAAEWRSNSFDHGVGGRVRIQRLTGIWDRELSIYLSIMGQCVEAARLPFPQRIAKARALQERIVTKHDTDPQIVVLMSFHSVATMLFPASVDKTHIRSAETQARLMAAQIALAVERYRVRYAGRLPTQLAELVPDELASVPADPFDGKPFRYKRLSQGYMIYSIGADGQDNGGLPKNPSKRDALYDVTFSVER